MKAWPFDQLDEITSQGCVGVVTIIAAPGGHLAWYLSAATNVGDAQPSLATEPRFRALAEMNGANTARELCDPGWRERLDELTRQDPGSEGEV